MSSRILSHFPVIIIFIVVILLSIGIGAHGGARAMTGMALFALATGITYFVALNFKAAKYPVTAIANIFVLPERLRIAGIWLVGLSAVGIALVHLVAFGGMTLGAALTARSNIEVALVRQAIIESLPTSMQYLNAIAIKALFPIGLLLAVTRRMKLLSFILAATGLFYAICMMQKSGPVILVLPVMTYFLFTGRWIKMVLTLVVAVGVVLFMGFVANPEILPASVHTALHGAGEAIPNDTKPIPEIKVAPIPAPEPNASPAVESTDGATVSLIKALVSRVAITPGDVAAKWFDAIPTDVPYGEGCGYRFLTRLLGCSFQNYSVILYDVFYPQDRAIGMRGTVNAASMMTAYANFGMLGIILSGILHGLIAWSLFVIFQQNPVLSPAFNITYLLLLSSGDLFTILLSGGWALSILLYLTLSRTKNYASIADSLASNPATMNAQSSSWRMP